MSAMITLPLVYNSMRRLYWCVRATNEFNDLPLKEQEAMQDAARILHSLGEMTDGIYALERDMFAQAGLDSEP